MHTLVLVALCAPVLWLLARALTATPLSERFHAIADDLGALTLSAADSALKEYYLPALREQLNNDIPILAQYQKNSEDIEGRRAVLSLHVTRNSGVGSRADGGTLPTAGQQGFAEERVPVKFHYGRGAVTGPTIAAMASDRGSFVRAIDNETRSIRNDLSVELARQAWGTTDGVLATCGTTTTSTTVVLATATTAVQMRAFQVGEKVDIGTKAAPTTVVSAATISAIDSTNKTITIDSSVSTTSSHFVFRSGNVAASSVSYELTGLQTIVDDANTLHNVNPSTYPDWKSVDNGNGGTNRSLSENLMAQVMQQVQIAGGEYPDIIVASDGVHRAFANLLTSLKRFPQTANLKGGYSGLDFTAGGPTVPVVWDRFCPSNSMYMLNTKHLIWFRMADWDFMDRDGAVLSRISGQDAYEFVLFLYSEAGTDKRNAHGRLVDITEA